MQTTAFFDHIFDFSPGFIMFFESSTEPQREAQNDQSEGTNSTLSRLLQWFSKSARKKYYKSADF